MMKQSNSEIDPLQLQRLVDGELDQEQTRQLLLDAQSAPDHWEQIAVGFVENQSFERAFDSRFSSQENPAASSFESSEQSVVPAPSQPSKVDRENEPAVAARKPNPRWVMAASLLAAAAIGYMASQIQSRNIPSNTIVDSAPRSAAVPNSDLAKNSNNNSAPKITPASLSPDYHLELPNENFQGFEDSKTNSRVPIYRVNNEKQLSQFLKSRQDTPPIPNDVMIRIVESGFQMEQEIEIISGEVRDGESFVVPVRTIRFLPYQ